MLRRVGGGHAGTWHFWLKFCENGPQNWHWCYGFLHCSSGMYICQICVVDLHYDYAICILYDWNLLLELPIIIEYQTQYCRYDTSSIHPVYHCSWDAFLKLLLSTICEITPITKRNASNLRPAVWMTLAVRVLLFIPVALTWIRTGNGPLGGVMFPKATPQAWSTQYGVVAQTQHRHQDKSWSIVKPSKKRAI